MMRSVVFILGALASVFSLHASTNDIDRSSSAIGQPAHELTHTQLIEAWGRIVAHESNADKFGFDELERAALVKGAEAGMARQPPPHELSKIHPDVIHFVETRTAHFRQELRKQNLAAAPAYFETLKKNPAVIALPSGLCYETIATGDGDFPRADQTVTARYHAHLIDGSEFDSTEQLGAVDIALRNVIAGWSEGIQKMRVGGKIRLHVPPSLGFDDNDATMMGIPPASIVVSEIELLAIKDTPVEEPAPASAPVPPPPEPAGFSVLEIIETWGWLLTQERGVVQAELSPDDRARFIEGLIAAMEQRKAAFDERGAYPLVAQFVSSRQEARQAALRKTRLAENAAFLETLKKNPRVISLPSGLRYEVIQSGESPYPKPDQRVLVNYTGTLIDGTVFDRTDPEMGPLEVDIAHVIRGWTEGIQKVGTGGRIKLYIPPELGYGDISTGGIPSAAVLIFDIELLKVSDIPLDDPKAETPPASAAQTSHS